MILLAHVKNNSYAGLEYAMKIGKSQARYLADTLRADSSIWIYMIEFFSSYLGFSFHLKLALNYIR